MMNHYLTMIFMYIQSNFILTVYVEDNHKVLSASTQQNNFGEHFATCCITLVKTMLSPMWRLAFSTKKCLTRHYSTVVICKNLNLKHKKIKVCLLQKR